MVKLPHNLFRNFALNGSVHVMLRLALTFQRERGWTKFELLSPDRRSDGLNLLLTLEAELKKV